MWPAIIIQRLLPQLPEDYVAEPRVHLGTNFEIDDCTFENSYPATKNYAEHGENGGIATAIWAPPEPTLAVDADPTEQYAYEVLVFDESRTRQLVAVVELVSPGNKDRPESRRDFVAKCAAFARPKRLRLDRRFGNDAAVRDLGLSTRRRSTAADAASLAHRRPRHLARPRSQLRRRMPSAANRVAYLHRDVNIFLAGSRPIKLHRPP